MKNITYIDTNNVEAIICRCGIICPYYEYRCEQRLLWIFIWRKAGIYSTVLDTMTNSDTLARDNLIVVNDIVYYMPHIKFVMSSGQTFIRYFDEINEYNDFIVDIEKSKKFSHLDAEVNGMI